MDAVVPARRRDSHQSYLGRHVSEFILPERLEKLVYWISEREKIRRLRESGTLAPWTGDKILQGVRFCNVRRMDDKVSKWLLDNWYPKNVIGYSQATVLAAAGLARLINWPDSLEGMINTRQGHFTKWDYEKAKTYFQARKAAGDKVFTGVYIINAAGGGSKVDIVLRQVNTLYLHPELMDISSMESTHSKLQAVPGIGSFIAGQIVADLRHAWPGPWSDRHTWAPLGPGSRRGMGWLHGWDGVAKLAPVRQSDFELFLADLVMQLRGFDEFIDVMKDRKLEMHDVQNCLCEYDKFMRLSNGTGQAKNKFNGFQSKLL